MGSELSNDQKKGNEAEVKPMTKADAAALVKRLEPVYGEDKKPVFKKGEQVFKPVPITEKDVFDFKEFDDYVVVVTIDGQKLRGDKPSK